MAIPLLATLLVQTLVTLPLQGVGGVDVASLEEDTLIIQFDEVEGTPLEEFIKLCQILTGNQLTYSPADTKDVRLRYLGEKRLPKDQFWAYFQAVLKAQDFVVVPYGRIGGLRVGEGAAAATGFYAVRRTAGGVGGGAKPGYIKSQAPVISPEDLPRFESDCGLIVTTSFCLHHVQVQEAMNMLQTYFTDPMLESVRAVGTTNSLVATGYAETLCGIDQLLQLIDQPPEVLTPRFARFPLKYAVAGEVAQILARMLDRQRGGRPAQAGPQPVPGQTMDVRIDADPRTNSVLVLAAPAAVDEIAGHIRTLDVAVTPAVAGGEAETRVIRLEHSPALELAQTLTIWVKTAGLGGAVAVVPDARTNSLLVTATTERIDQVKRLVAQLDIEVEGAQEDQEEEEDG